MFYVQKVFCCRNVKKTRPVLSPSIRPDDTEDYDNRRSFHIVKYDKDEISKQIIADSITQNEFLRTLIDDDQLNMVIDAMYLQEYEAETEILNEGETGTHLYVAAEGIFEVYRGGVKVKKFTTRETFGELSLLYNVKRCASIKTVTKAKAWVLDGQVFRHIIRSTVQKERTERMQFLQSIPFLQTLPSMILARISDMLVKEFFSSGETIIRQGDVGDKFYIVRAGSVSVIKDSKPVGIFSKGQIFGELALLKYDVRQATVLAQAPGAECLTLDVINFKKYLGNIDELSNIDYSSYHNNISHNEDNRTTSQYSHIRLQDLRTVSVLGYGDGSRIKLVHLSRDKSTAFVLKCISKYYIHNSSRKYQKQVFNERDLLFSCNQSQFICKLYKTFKDDVFIYFLLEPCLGGDISTLLERKHKAEHRALNDNEARFIAACIIEALNFLHNHGIIHRDLNANNVVLDYKGYAKLVDFGSSKRVTENKTYTFTGNVHYMAPEMILNQGHNKAIDFWALGILVFFMLSNTHPFDDEDHLIIFDSILKGISKVKFPSSISSNGHGIIKKLCRDKPSERLGYIKEGIQGLRDHKWFHKFDWLSLQNRQLPAPIIKPIKHPIDQSNFKKQREIELPPEEVSGWDKDF